MDTSRQPLLKTKLFIPHLRQETVRRPRLVEQLNQGLKNGLILLSAQAGSGKTTLLAEWVEQLHLPVAWLSLDEGDNDPVRFLSYLTSALHSLSGEIATWDAGLADSLSNSVADASLTILINEICTYMDEFVFILDDYHVIRERSVQQILQFLVEHLPENMCLVVASRTDPALPLPRLRARKKLAEIRAGDLRFDLSETGEFFERAAGLVLSTQDICTLEARTEGWIVGLQMAAISLREHANPSAFIQAFSGSNRFVLDYLAEEVLNLQPPPIQDFMLQTSILERLYAPLCEAVSGKAGAQERLENMERSNLFLVPLDVERKYYRYHHLFADLLKARLERREGKEELVRLHHRAAAWYEENSEPSEAIQHALAAGEMEWAASLVEKISETFWLNGEYTRLIHWLRSLPDEAIKKRPWLCLRYAWSLTQDGALEEADHWIAAAADALENAHNLDDPQKKALREEIIYFHILRAGFNRDYKALSQLASFATQHRNMFDQVSSLTVRGNFLHALSSIFFAAGDLDKAEKICNFTIKTVQEGGFFLRRIHAVYKLAHIQPITGRLQQPFHTLQDTLTAVQQEGKGGHFPVVYLYCGLADLFYEWNRLEECHNMIQESLRLNALARVPHVLVDSYSAMARLRMAQHEVDEAQELLDQAAALIKKYYCWSELEWSHQSLQVRLWLMKGDLPRALRWVDEQPFCDEDPIPFYCEVNEISRARVLLVSGQLNRARDLLEKLSEAARRGCRKGRLLEILALYSMTLHALGAVGEARASLGETLELAKGEGYMRSLLDAGEGLEILLATLAQEAGSPQGIYARKLLAVCRGEEAKGEEAQTSRPYPSGGRYEALTPREMEVLRAMADGLNNTEIARKLVVAVSTIKRHIHHIFAKLDAASRTQALVRARQLGLLK